MILVALSLWHWGGSIPSITIRPTQLDVSDPWQIGYSYPDPDVHHCVINLTAYGQTFPADVQQKAITHEVGHCLLFQYGYYDHFPWTGVMTMTTPMPTDNDLAGLAIYARLSQSHYFVHIPQIAN